MQFLKNRKIGSFIATTSPLNLRLTGVECDTSREKPLYVVDAKRLWSDRREDWQVNFRSISWNQGHSEG